MWWSKKPVEPMESADYQKLSKKIMDIETEVSKLSGALSILELKMTSLKGMVNRKIGYEQKEAERGVLQTNATFNNELGL